MPDFEQVGALTRQTDGQELALGFGCLRVGRQRRADLILSDKTVSRHHADICFESGRYMLYDHSSNGTWVNDALVSVAEPLRDGDHVKFGRTEFRFEMKAVPKGSAARTGTLEPAHIPRWSTLIMRGGKRGMSWRGVFWRVLTLVLLAAIVALAVYLLFPGVVGRILP